METTLKKLLGDDKKKEQDARQAQKELESKKAQ